MEDPPRSLWGGWPWSIMAAYFRETDLALRVVAWHHGEAVAWAKARHTEYPYPGDNARWV